MNIIEGNKLIAEFMGYIYFPYVYELKKDGFNRWGWRKGKPHLPGGNSKIDIGKTHYIGRHHRDLKFHEDWNWLNDVVREIFKISKENDLFINKKFGPILSEIKENLVEIDINKVWESSVGFIKEYNK